jgi:hypothetical protein
LIGYLDKPNQRLLTGQDPGPVNGHAESNGATKAAIEQYVWLSGLPLAQIESNGTIEFIHADQTNTCTRRSRGSGARTQ